MENIVANIASVIAIVGSAAAIYLSIRKAPTEVDNLEAEITLKFQKMLNEKMDRLYKMQVEIDELRDRINKLVAENASLKSRVVMLEEENNDLRAQLKSLGQRPRAPKTRPLKD